MHMSAQNGHMNPPLSSSSSSSSSSLFQQTTHALPSNSNNTTFTDIYNNNNPDNITQQILGDGNVNFDEDNELKDKRNNYFINPPVPLPPPTSLSSSHHQQQSHTNFAQPLPSLANKLTDNHQLNGIHKRQVAKLEHIFV